MITPTLQKWLVASTLILMTSALQAASLSKSSLTLTIGQSATVSVSKIKGIAQLINNSSDIVSATLSSATRSGNLQISGLKTGKTSLIVKDASGSKTLSITVTSPMTLSTNTLSLAFKEAAKVSIKNANGKIRLSNSNSTVASASLSGSTITVIGKTTGTSKITVKDNLTTQTIAVTVATPPPPVSGNTNGRLLASNCFQCHGTNGSGGFDDIMGKDDVYQELQEFLNGQEDADGIMAAHIKGYTDEQLRAIADYLANP
jgi:sulfide dehydrogenase cytochrome subunit